MLKKIALLGLIGWCVLAQAQNKGILLLNGVAHIGNGEVIQNSAIAIKGDKIDFVADATTIRIDKSAFDTIINIFGKHVYPGFILPDSRLGLVEIDAVRATVDFAETGGINPNARALISYNTDSKIIPTLRTNGILLAQVAPVGGLISGTSSIMKLQGWNWEDAVYKADDGVFMNWPVGAYYAGAWYDDEPTITKNDDKPKQLAELKKFFEEAKAYSTLTNPSPLNIRFEAVKGLFTGKQKLFINANKASEITEAVLFAKSMRVTKIVIVGGQEAYKVVDLLKENKVGVVLTRLHSLPDKPEGDVDHYYKMAKTLNDAGIDFCLSYNGDMEVMGARNLPFIAGTAAAYGLDKEVALASITSKAAKILGIDASVGTLEKEKKATLFVSTGDALDMLGNNVELAYINGDVVDLNNHQKDLYKKYKAKYGIE